MYRIKLFAVSLIALLLNAGMVDFAHETGAEVSPLANWMLLIAIICMAPLAIYFIREKIEYLMEVFKDE